MKIEDLLEMVKVDLQLFNSTFDNYLIQLIQVAKAEITREGITLQDTLDDNQTIVMYAAYLYRKRASENTSMPRMLRYRLNNRVFAEKLGMDVVQDVAE